MSSAAEKKQELELMPQEQESQVPAERSGTELAQYQDKSESMVVLEMIRDMSRDPNFDPAKMQQIIDMRKEMFMENARIEFNAAMARVQAKIEPVVRDADNRQTNSKYAKLETIVAAIAPHYTAEGFALSFDQDACPVPEHEAKGWFRTVCEVSHEGGYSKTFHVDLPPDIAGIQGKVNKTPIHGVKSSISYAKNMLICMIFNVATKDEDDDGNGAGGQLSEKAADWIAKLEECTDMETLQSVFTQAFKDLDGDGYGRNQINAVKDRKKKELS